MAYLHIKLLTDKCSKMSIIITITQAPGSTFTGTENI